MIESVPMLVHIDHVHDILLRLPHAKKLALLCRDRNAYVVGGAVRDALLDLPIKDVDIIYPDDPTELAKIFARQSGGHWFWLDKERRQSRVVFNDNVNCPDFDFAPFRAPTLGQDLLDRDFTINAIAIPFTVDSAENTFVDPLCGLDDLRNNVLRMVGSRSFTSDPLRILKGIRHATVLDVEPEIETLRSMKREVTGLYRVAEERIRQEIWKIFASKNASHGLRLLDLSMTGNYLFNNNYSAATEGLVKRLELCRNRWVALSRQYPVIKDWLAGDVEQGLSCETLILWTLLLVQFDPGLPVKLADEWMLSRKAKSNIKGLAAIEGKVVEEFACVYHSERAFAWWARRSRVEPKILLLAVAVAELDNHDELIGQWVQLVDSLEGGPLEDLVNGHWLRSGLGLQDGPEMTSALSLVREAEISGQVKDEDDAQNFLLRYYKNMD
jgi:poly(A) polymerase